MKDVTRIKKFKRELGKAVCKPISVDESVNAYVHVLRNKLRGVEVNVDKSEMLATLNMPVRSTLRVPKKEAKAIAALRKEIISKGCLKGEIIARRSRELSTDEMLDVIAGNEPALSVNFYLVTFGKEMDKVLEVASEGCMKLLKSKKLDSYTYFLFDDNSKKNIETFLSNKLGAEVSITLELGKVAQFQNKLQEIKNGGIL